MDLVPHIELKIQSKHSTAQADPTGSDSSAMLQSPHPDGAVSLAAYFCYLYLFQFDCPCNTKENMINRLCVLMQTHQKKKSKREGNDVFKQLQIITTRNHHV